MEYNFIMAVTRVLVDFSAGLLPLVDLCDTGTAIRHACRHRQQRRSAETDRTAGEEIPRLGER